tara:strand:- start:579 stop:1253 length:675 start_codon:yes stop_codon:yes gene_type:complete
MKQASNFGAWNRDGDWEPEYGDRVDMPADVFAKGSRAFLKSCKPVKKMLISAFRELGWKVKKAEFEEVFENDSSSGALHWGDLCVEFVMELEIKGGQTLTVDRKKIVADGNRTVSVGFYCYSESSEEVEYAEDYVVQRDVDEFERFPTHYVIPDTSFDRFHFSGYGKPRTSSKLQNRRFWPDRDDCKLAASLYTKEYANKIFKSKWKKMSSEEVVVHRFLMNSK